MFQSKAITLKELQSVLSKPKQSIKAAEPLLNIVADQSSTVYVFFMNALKDTGHKEVHDSIVYDSYKGMLCNWVTQKNDEIGLVDKIQMIDDRM